MSCRCTSITCSRAWRVVSDSSRVRRATSSSSRTSPSIRSSPAISDLELRCSSSLCRASSSRSRANSSRAAASCCSASNRTVAAVRSVASTSARRCSSATTRRMSDVDALRSASSCPLRLTRIRSNAARMSSSSVDDTLYLKTWLSLASLTKRACRTFHCPSPSTHTWEIGETWGDG